MAWLGLLLMLVAFRRGWILAPMLLFTLPFAGPVIGYVLEERGIHAGLMLPDAIQGFTIEMVSVAGLAMLALHRRRI
jgi:hypothetical protein